MYIQEVESSSTTLVFGQRFTIRFLISGKWEWDPFNFVNGIIYSPNDIPKEVIMSNIKTVVVKFNGQSYNATLDPESQKYEVSITAPNESSWSQPDHVFKAVIEATDKANNVATMDSDNPTYGDQLKIRVLEKTKPTATIVSPTQGSVLGASEQDIVLEMSDNGGSGLNETTVVFTVNGESHAGDLSFTDHEGKRRATYHATGLKDGQNTITFQVTDNDGNISELATTTFVVSTTAPSLTVDTPTEGLITNSNRLTVIGSTTPGSDAVTIADVKVNNASVSLTGDRTKTFSHEITLTEGENTITVVSTDSIGKATSVTRHVTLDTKAPIITDVVAEATTVDSGGTIKITFKVTDPEA